MKKVAVYSFFDSHNIGDILISRQVEKIFSDNTDATFFNIGNGKKKDECGLKEYCPAVNKVLKHFLLSTPFVKDMVCSLASFFSKSSAQLIESAEGFDTVVFAGGNIIMELNLFPASIRNLYCVVKALKEKKKKIVFCFCGVGPFKSFLSYGYAKKPSICVTLFR